MTKEESLEYVIRDYINSGSTVKQLVLDMRDYWEQYLKDRLRFDVNKFDKIINSISEF